MVHKLDVESQYKWESSDHTCAHSYLLPTVLKILEAKRKKTRTKDIFDLGCGNGSVANELSKNGFDVIGVDPSPEGIKQSKNAYPNLNLYKGSAYDNLSKKYGRFNTVISLEVVEHVFLPRSYAKTIFNLLKPGGSAIFSTPYHGYWKNLAIALTHGFDRHVNPLWDYGHIKFWSIKTVSQLLVEAGFSRTIKFYFVGRIPLLAKSMIFVAQKTK